MSDNRIAVYIRLSMADEETGKAKAESESVANQRALINRFLDRHPKLSQYQRTEFCDDGYTGTNMDRPAFIEMMDRIKKGEFNVVCVKDFSRFSRDYIEIGDCLECLFPFLRVRFISINDNYDSEDYKGTTGGMDVVMRNIVYAAYSKDLSMKTTTAKIQCMKQGKYVGAFAPYGFTFHPAERNKLFADPDAAQVVRRIFDFAIAGQKPAEIAKRLNADKVPTPGQYFVAKHPENRKFSAMSEQIAWTYRMVYTILTKQVYTGAAVGHVRKTTVPLSRQTVKQDKSNWIVVRGAHEAIVSEEEFELAQATIHKIPAEKAKSVNLYPLRSLVRCGCCGRVMERSRRKTFCCPYGRYNKDGTCDSTVHYSEAELEKVVFGTIQMFLQTAVSNCSFSGKSQKRRTSEIKNKMKILSELQKQVEKWNGQKLSLYEQYVDGSISKQIYLEQKTDLTKKIAASDNEIGRLEADITQLELPLSAGETMLERAVTAHAGDDSLTYEMAHAFVHAVYAFPDGRYEINWKFKDIAVSIR